MQHISQSFTIMLIIHKYLDVAVCRPKPFPIQIYLLKQLKLWHKSCFKMLRNDMTTPLSAIRKNNTMTFVLIWPDMLNTHATELIRSTLYAHVLYAMLDLSCWQWASTSSLKLYSIVWYAVSVFAQWIACDISMHNYLVNSI